MEAHTGTGRTQHLLDLIKRVDDALNSRDLDVMDELLHPQIVCHVTGSGKPTTGRLPHRKAVEDMVRAFPDFRVHNDPYPIQFGQGDWVTVIGKITGTFTGELTGPDGRVIPPTGKSFEVNFTTNARWAGDQVIEEWVFWDSALLMQQTGLSG